MGKNKPFTFKQLGIPIGSILVYTEDSFLVCKTLDDKRAVEFMYEKTTLSRAVYKIKALDGRTWRGPAYWSYNGKVLSDIFDKLHNKI